VKTIAQGGLPEAVRFGRVGTGNAIENEADRGIVNGTSGIDLGTVIVNAIVRIFVTVIRRETVIVTIYVITNASGGWMWRGVETGIASGIVIGIVVSGIARIRVIIDETVPVSVVKFDGRNRNTPPAYFRGPTRPVSGCERSEVVRMVVYTAILSSRHCL
jgi:hypothetical protein